MSFFTSSHPKTLNKKTSTYYVKKDVLGVGSFGIVFRGSHRGVDVAVKRIELHRLDTEEREAKLQMKLEHENVLKIFTVEKDDDYRYIVLELCFGTLDQVYEKGKVYGGPALPPDQTVMYQIANGLDYIHSKKLIHRDVKPENILISKTGDSKISEFGLCKRISPRETFSIGGLKGTASWMAPELLMAADNEGEIPVKGTISSDIFSAGCVFFVFATRGIHPFGEVHIAVQSNIRNNQQVNIDKLKSDHFTSSIIRKMIEPEPSRRMPLTQVKELLVIIPRRPRVLGSLGSFNEAEHRNTTSNKEVIAHTPPARRRAKSIQSERRKQVMHKFHGLQLASSPTSDAGRFFPMSKGATFGVPLENCPRSSKYENIPKIVEVCIDMIEDHGMESVGVYRVPGNQVVVNDISDCLNSGDFDQLHPRGNEVNVVSSVMKSFFRKLPDPLVTSELYGPLIEASKLEPDEFRLTAIKRLVDELPDPYYSTLRYLIVHLSRVAGMSSVNKMDARNLATVFGPTLIRPGDDSMTTLMTDMAHQCRIVEMLIDKVGYFFPPLPKQVKHSISLPI